MSTHRTPRRQAILMVIASASAGVGGASAGAAGCSSFEGAPASGDASTADSDATPLDGGADSASLVDGGGSFGPPALFFDDDGGAMTLALDHDNVYWAGAGPNVPDRERDIIRKRPKVGNGDVQFLHSTLSAGPIVTDIAPSAARVVWSAGNGGCTSDAVGAHVTATANVEFVTTCMGRLFQTGSAVYASSPNTDAGALHVFDKAKSITLGSLLANGPFTGPLASDDAKVYAATETDIVSVTIPGGAIELVVNLGGVLDLALSVDGRTLFAATRTSITSLALDTNAVNTLAAAKPLRIAVDPAFVYWIDGTASKVMRVTRAVGGAPETLADTQGEPTAIAVDDRALYWSTATGKIFVMPRR